jgi:hypothetical protein
MIAGGGAFAGFGAGFMVLAAMSPGAEAGASACAGFVSIEVIGAAAVESFGAAVGSGGALAGGRTVKSGGGCGD